MRTAFPIVAWRFLPSDNCAGEANDVGFIADGGAMSDCAADGPAGEFKRLPTGDFGLRGAPARKPVKGKMRRRVFERPYLTAVTIPQSHSKQFPMNQ